MKHVNEIIKALDLSPHPEGGYFRETYRSDGFVDQQSLPKAFDGNRSYSTCIYFLLTSDTFSAFHKINQDEIWHFYDGSPVELHTISSEGKLDTYIIGRNFDKGQVPQLVVPADHWFAAKVIEPESYSLVGCTVAPGFDFKDFTLPTRTELLESFPEHRMLIESFTRE